MSQSIMKERDTTAAQISDSQDEVVERVKARLQEEGREARNLVAYSLPLQDPPQLESMVRHREVKRLAENIPRRASKQEKRPRSASAGRDPQASLRARHWGFLFRNLQQAVDEIYQTCEDDESIVECKEAIMMLERYTSDFQKLIEWLKLKWEYEHTPPPQRPTSLTWEIRTSSPGKAVHHDRKMLTLSDARRALTFDTCAERLHDKKISGKLNIGRNDGAYEQKSPVTGLIMSPKPVIIVHQASIEEKVEENGRLAEGMENVRTAAHKPLEIVNECEKMSQTVSECGGMNAEKRVVDGKECEGNEERCVIGKENMIKQIFEGKHRKKTVKKQICEEKRNEKTMEKQIIEEKGGMNGKKTRKNQIIEENSGKETMIKEISEEKECEKRDGVKKETVIKENSEEKVNEKTITEEKNSEIQILKSGTVENAPINSKDIVNVEKNSDNDGNSDKNSDNDGNSDKSRNSDKCDDNVSKKDNISDSDTKKSDCGDSKRPDCADSKRPDCADSKRQDCADSKRSDCADLKRQDCADSKRPDCADSKRQDCADSKRPDCADSKRQDCADLKRSDCVETKRSCAEVLLAKSPIQKPAPTVYMNKASQVRQAYNQNKTPQKQMRNVSTNSNRQPLFMRPSDAKPTLTRHQGVGGGGGKLTYRRAGDGRPFTSPPTTRRHMDGTGRGSGSSRHPLPHTITRSYSSLGTMSRGGSMRTGTGSSSGSGIGGGSNRAVYASNPVMNDGLGGDDRAASISSLSSSASSSGQSWADKVRGATTSLPSSHLSLQDDGEGWEVVRRGRRSHGGSTASLNSTNNNTNNNNKSKNNKRYSSKDTRSGSLKMEGHSCSEIKKRFHMPSSAMSLPSLIINENTEANDTHKNTSDKNTSDSNDPSKINTKENTVEINKETDKRGKKSMDIKKQNVFKKVENKRNRKNTKSAEELRKTVKGEEKHGRIKGMSDNFREGEKYDKDGVRKLVKDDKENRDKDGDSKDDVKNAVKGDKENGENKDSDKKTVKCDKENGENKDSNKKTVKGDKENGENKDDIKKTVKDDKENKDTIKKTVKNDAKEKTVKDGNKENVENIITVKNSDKENGDNNKTVKNSKENPENNITVKDSDKNNGENKDTNKKTVKGNKEKGENHKTVKNSKENVENNLTVTDSRVISSFNHVCDPAIMETSETSETSDCDDDDAPSRPTGKSSSRRPKMINGVDESEGEKPSRSEDLHSDNDGKNYDSDSQMEDEELLRNAAALESAVQEEQRLKKQIEETEKTEIEVDAEDDCEEDGSDASESAGRALSPLTPPYDNLLSNMSWADQVDACESLEELRHPGRVLHIHEKLSSPSRKRSLSEKMRRHEERLAKAQELRESLILAKTEKLKDLFKKIEEVRQDKEGLLVKKRDLFEQKMKLAEEKRRQYLQEIVNKAHDEENKAKEIAFINGLEAQNKLHDIMQQHQSHESRLADMAEERTRRQEEKAAKEVAAQERRKALEAERQARMAELCEKRRKRCERIDRQQAERREELLEQAREKARDREERLSALQQAQQAKESELVKKIQQKQEESARRHEENIEQIRQRALESSIMKYSRGCDDAPRLVRYETKKLCTLCNSLITSEVYLLSHLRGRRHQEALKALHQADVVSNEDSETYNLKHIIDAPANIDDPQVTRDKERHKALKRRCRKIRSRMMTRGKEFNKAFKPTPIRESPNKVRISKALQQIAKLVANQGSGPWPTADLTALDRPLLELIRILEKRESGDQMVFSAQDGFTKVNSVLRVILESTEQRPCVLPAKSLGYSGRVLVSACLGNVENCRYVLNSNLVGTVIDYLMHRLNELVEESTRIGSNNSINTIVNLPSDSASGAMFELLAEVVRVVCESEVKIAALNGDSGTPTKDHTDITWLRLQDVVSYCVSVGLVDKVWWYFGHVQGPLDADPGVVEIILSAMRLVASLASALAAKHPSDDPTQLIGTLHVTDACGVVSLLYGLLLHQGGRSAMPNTPPRLSHITQSLTVAATTLLQNLALLDLNMFQGVLGGEGISLEFRHIASYLLWYCSHWPTQDILHNIITLVGYFTANNKDNQGVVQSGEVPSVLQQLCNLPWQYFSETHLTALLFPTLLACCLGNPDNMVILEQEMSFQLLEDFLHGNQMIDNQLIKLLQRTYIKA